MCRQASWCDSQPRRPPGPCFLCCFCGPWAAGCGAPSSSHCPAGPAGAAAAGCPFLFATAACCLSCRPFGPAGAGSREGGDGRWAAYGERPGRAADPRAGRGGAGGGRAYRGASPEPHLRAQPTSRQQPYSSGGGGAQGYYQETNPRGRQQAPGGGGGYGSGGYSAAGYGAGAAAYPAKRRELSRSLSPPQRAKRAAYDDDGPPGYYAPAPQPGRDFASSGRAPYTAVAGRDRDQGQQQYSSSTAHAGYQRRSCEQQPAPAAGQPRAARYEGEQRGYAPGARDGGSYPPAQRSREGHWGGGRDSREGTYDSSRDTHTVASDRWGGSRDSREGPAPHSGRERGYERDREPAGRQPYRGEREPYGGRDEREAYSRGERDARGGRERYGYEREPLPRGGAYDGRPPGEQRYDPRSERFPPGPGEPAGGAGPLGGPDFGSHPPGGGPMGLPPLGAGLVAASGPPGIALPVGLGAPGAAAPAGYALAAGPALMAPGGLPAAVVMPQAAFAASHAAPAPLAIGGGGLGGPPAPAGIRSASSVDEEPIWFYTDPQVGGQQQYRSSSTSSGKKQQHEAAAAVACSRMQRQQQQAGRLGCRGRCAASTHRPTSFATAATRHHTPAMCSCTAPARLLSFTRCA